MDRPSLQLDLSFCIDMNLGIKNVDNVGIGKYQITLSIQ